jgi:hypothetical protein
MSIAEFLTVYRVSLKRDGIVEFIVQKKPAFIQLVGTYSNNKEWKQQVFRVSGQWERAESSFFLEDQRVPWE